uniref:Uncharacterized protein n=1 Tax=Arundo donax TaxID=35708 RepID=A0A0A9HV60_ARUDO
MYFVRFHPIMDISCQNHLASIEYFLLFLWTRYSAQTEMVLKFSEE